MEKPPSAYVAAGGFHSAIVDDEGILHTFGRSAEGQLGQGVGTTTRDGLEPSTVSMDAFEGHQIKQVACGIKTSAAITEEGKLYTWGYGKAYLGHADIYIESEKGSFDVNLPRPVRFPGQNTQTISAISLGWSHCCALTFDGNVYTWGYGGSGRLGHGDEETRIPPKRVQGVSTHEAASVAAGGAFTLVKMKNGLVVAWGAAHACGQEGEANVLEPKVMNASRDLDTVHIAAGGLHACLCTREGDAYTWGWGGCGQLGLGRRITDVVKEPTRVDTMDQKIILVSCGSYHTALVEEGGELMTFGAGGRRYIPEKSTEEGEGDGEDADGDEMKKKEEAEKTRRARLAMGIKLDDKEKKDMSKYVNTRVKKDPDGRDLFRKQLAEIEKEDERKKEMRQALKDNNVDVAKKDRQLAIEAAQKRFNIGMIAISNRIVEYVEMANPVPAVMRCLGRHKAEEEEPEDTAPKVIEHRDPEEELRLQQEKDGQHGEMCRLGFAGMEELDEEGGGDRIKPRVVSGPWRLKAGSRVVGVSCGPYHTLAVTEAGEVYAFGTGLNGRLGLGHEEPKGAPTRIDALSKKGVSVGHPGRRMGMTAFANFSTAHGPSTIANIKVDRKVRGLPNRGRTDITVAKGDVDSPFGSMPSSPPPESDDDMMSGVMPPVQM